MISSCITIITCIAKVPTPPDPPRMRTLHKKEANPQLDLQTPEDTGQNNWVNLPFLCAVVFVQTSRVDDGRPGRARHVWNRWRFSVAQRTGLVWHLTQFLFSCESTILQCKYVHKTWDWTLPHWHWALQTPPDYPASTEGWHPTPDRRRHFNTSSLNGHLSNFPQCTVSHLISWFKILHIEPTFHDLPRHLTPQDERKLAAWLVHV